MKNTYLIIIALLFFSISFSQTEKEKVQETITKGNIEGHIYFLADDLLKGRETGTNENKIAASYLANSFRRYGVKPNPKTGTYYQDVKLKRVSPPNEVTLEINGQKINDYAFIFPSPLHTESDAVYLNYGLEEDYKGKNLKGKVIIIKSGSAEAKDTRAAFDLRGKKQELAQANGVTAILELLNVDENIWGFIDHNFNGSKLMPAENEEGDNNKSYDEQTAHIWILDKGNKMTEALSVSKQISTKVSISEKKEEIVMSQNVIGLVEGTDSQLKNEYIIYSAHYDHVGIGTPDATGDSIYNGARDNAIGVTTVLSMAENLAKYPTKRSGLFILFTGEEKGLLGSEYYVNNPVLPLNQMVYCFNSDNGGYNDITKTTIIGLERTTAEEDIKNASNEFGLTAIDDPAPEQGLFDRSDNVHFAKKGIPSPTFSLGFTAFNGEVTKYYHRPGDEADTLDYDYLVKFFGAYVLSGRNIANNPNVPFWTIGDKYEVIGNKLYNRNIKK